MIHAALAPRIGREFDPFLFAAIGEDRHGQLLSVISALARSDLDPWQEAVGLARMSRDVATTRLSRLIAALPGEPTSDRSVDAIASELIALLPRTQDFARAAPGPAVLAAVVAPKARFVVAACALALMVAISLLVSTRAPSGPERGAAPADATENGAPKPSTRASDHRP
jgi:hypothetical protein